MKQPRIPEQSPVPVPLKANPIIVDPSDKRYRNMRDAAMLAGEPAESDLTALAIRIWGEASLKNGLGTTRAPYLLSGFDEAFLTLYMLPVSEMVPGAVEVSYASGKASFNLYDAFSYTNRLVPTGRREIYPLKPTPDQVEIGGVKGWGLYCSLSEVTSEPINYLSEEEKARRQATRDGKKQKEA